MPSTISDIDYGRMVELAHGILTTPDPAERRYFQGRFDEYASQNAIDDEWAAKIYEAARVSLPPLRLAATEAAPTPTDADLDAVNQLALVGRALSLLVVPAAASIGVDLHTHTGDEPELNIHRVGRDGMVYAKAQPGASWHDDEYGNPKWVEFHKGGVEITYYR